MRISLNQTYRNVVPSSFRDPSGFLYRDSQGVLLRQVNASYGDDYRLLMQSGLYGDLVKRGWLVAHEEVDSAGSAGIENQDSNQALFVLKPREIAFISYPVEWSFSQLQDAALLTLDIAIRSLAYGMTLKDASAFNVQFEGSKPVFIDTLSFERYVEGEPWVAYAQFCRHFLAPLALMAKKDIRLNHLLACQVEGIDLDLASRLLPKRTLFSPGLLIHLHLHARFQTAFSNTTKSNAIAQKAQNSKKMSRTGLVELLRSLRRTVAGLKWRAAGTEWADYYTATSYDEAAFEAKREAVRQMLATLNPTTVWDLGANTGVFSRVAVGQGAYVCSFDIDPACVERSYLACRQEKNDRIQPLVLNLASPTPATGWALTERSSVVERGPCHTAMALALIHHLAISNNVPLPGVASFLAQICTNLIIEFVPKSDPQVQRLLRSRKDIFQDYHVEGFESAFQKQFNILEYVNIGTDGRILYRMSRK